MRIAGEKNYFKLWALLAIFIVPFIISFFLYFYHDYFKFKTTNHGKLIQPVLATPELLIPGKKTWQIIFVPSDCLTPQNENIMFSLHQLRRILGKNSERVELTLATKKICLLHERHDFRVLQLDEALYSRIQNALANRKVENNIYLLDPAGNLLMVYESVTNPMNILHDMQHLLEVSQIG